MSQAEYQLWLGEYQRRPWGEDIEDLRIATAIAKSAAVNASVHGFKIDLAVKDYIPRFEPAVEQSEEEMEEECRGFFRLLNARK